MSGARPERLLGILLVLGILATVVLATGLLDPQSASAPPGRDGVPPGTRAEVTGVTDGDTIVVVVAGTRERVRYIGLDAPELADDASGRAAECGGDAARDANAALVEGAAVILERDVSDRDRFGRLLRHVWTADGDAWRLVGEALVEMGAAEARSFPPDIARDAELDAAERRARDAGVGIWGSC